MRLADIEQRAAASSITVRDFLSKVSANSRIDLKTFFSQTIRQPFLAPRPGMPLSILVTALPKPRRHRRPCQYLLHPSPLLASDAV